MVLEVPMYNTKEFTKSEMEQQTPIIGYYLKWKQTWFRFLERSHQKNVKHELFEKEERKII